MLSLAPAQYRAIVGWLAALVLIAGLYLTGKHDGAADVHAEWDADKAHRAARAAEVKADQADATVQVVTQYVDRVQTVRLAGATIIKEVPVYVSQKSDADCVIPRGFVRLHDAAAAGVDPDPADDADAPATGIALSAVATTVAENYAACRENAATLSSLQEWVRAQAEAVGNQQ